MAQKKTTVAILTTFQDFNPGYSLTGIVVDQVHMLVRHGHKVILMVNENFNPAYNDDAGLNQVMCRYPDQVIISQKIQSIHLTDYSSDNLTTGHEVDAALAANKITKEFIDYDVDFAFTHDFVFTGWNLPYFHALIKASKALIKKRHVMWYHWIHSVPMPQNRKEWWSLEKLGIHHFLVFPNKTEIMRVAESYRTSPSRVKVIHHIKDIRTWYDFGDDSMELIDACPNIMNAHLSQVYPCSTDRLSAKQLDVVLRIFGNLKNITKLPVFLIIANQWATGKQPKENINEFREIAIENGLSEFDDFCFTSEMNEKWQAGITKRMLRELQLLTNLFIFPTKEESFGLVGPESAFSGALPIVNRSLNMMSEIMTHDAPAFEFGSFQKQHNIEDTENYYKAISMAILNRAISQDALLVKNACRIRFNMDSLYYHVYLPLLTQEVL